MIHFSYPILSLKYRCMATGCSFKVVSFLSVPVIFHAFLQHNKQNGGCLMDDGEMRLLLGYLGV